MRWGRDKSAPARHTALMAGENDGAIAMAPTVVSEIPGGRIQITLGSDSAEAQERQARGLAEAIMRRDPRPTARWEIESFEVIAADRPR